MPTTQTKRKSKLIFCALGLLLPGSGMNCFYLRGFSSLWAWFHLLALLMGCMGLVILREAECASASGWFLLSLGFISLEASWLTTIAFGLRPDQRWDAQFNPLIDVKHATKSGWLTVLTVIFSLVFGAGVMMTFLAIAFEQFFISQLQEARKLSQ